MRQRFLDLLAPVVGFLIVAAPARLLAQTPASPTHVSQADAQAKAQCLIWDLDGTDVAQVQGRVFKLYDKGATGTATTPGVVALPVSVTAASGGVAGVFTVKFDLPDITVTVTHCYAFTSTDGTSDESDQSTVTCYIVDAKKPKPAPGRNGHIGPKLAVIAAAVVGVVAYLLTRG